MSPADRVTVRTFREFKKRGEPIVVLTAYDYQTAKILDTVGVDALLVGDTANMVFYGQPTTLSITLEQMLYHTQAVSRAAGRALVIGDMPFLSYQISPSEAVANAGRFLKEAGAAAIKLEGGVEIAPTVKHLVEVGIPVMGHIGLTPQAVHKMGGYPVQGKNEKSVAYLLESAQALEEAGAFSLVMEGVYAEAARKITQTVSVPTIGIGAGPGCDGQVLVTSDLLGIFSDFKPKFVRRYANLSEEIRKAVSSFVSDVKHHRFPSEEESY
ncbi:MAG: 3-methyl-2-oxobutanoate hydroxymethyltransferase [candidate division Zixibacteria bacterium]|nr:3-methyl-2-oxobutanoate hydroxymethyltransferase [candidate division Zixibacteria bacterium]